MEEFLNVRQTTVSVIKEAFMDNIKRVPSYIKKNCIWITVLAVLWIPLMTIPTYRLPKAALILIFLTAAYNNFIAKFLYISVISNIILPVIRENKIGELFANIGKSIGIIKKSFISLKTKGIILAVGSIGFGLIVSNFLTRNNKIDKYLICVLVAVAILKSLSDGVGNLLIKFGSALYSDIKNMFSKEKKGISLKNVYVVYSSFAIGLIANPLSIKLFKPFRGIFKGFRSIYDKFNNFYDPSGYFLGLLLIITAIILSLILVRKPREGNA